MPGLEATAARKDSFLDYVEHLRARHKQVADAIAQYRSFRNRPSTTTQQLQGLMEPLQLTQQDRDFFAALPMDRPEFSDRFFEELRYSMVYGEPAEGGEFMKMLSDGRMPTTATVSTSSARRKPVKEWTMEELDAELELYAQKEMRKKSKKKKPTTTTRPPSAIETSSATNGKGTPVVVKKTIAQRRFEEYLQEREERLQAELSIRFVAKPIPSTSRSTANTSGEPSSARRRLRTQSAVDSSSYFLAQTDVEKLKEMRFRAKPVPEQVLHPVTAYHVPNAEERQRRVRERAQQIMAQSALPSRMERAKQETEAGVKKKKCGCPDPDAECTFHPKITRSIPDYQRLQEEFQHQLEERRKLLAGNRLPILRKKETNEEDSEDVAEVRAEVGSSKAVKAATPQSPKKTASRQEKTAEKGASNPDTSSTPVTPDTPSGKTLSAAGELPRDTHSAQLKREHNLRLLRERELQQEQEREILRERKERSKKLSSKVQNALQQDIVEYESRRRQRSQSSAGKLMQESSRAYQEYLDKLEQRMEEQPCLFERMKVETNKQRAEKIFDATLEQHGVMSKPTRRQRRATGNGTAK